LAGVTSNYELDWLTIRFYQDSRLYVIPYSYKYFMEPKGIILTHYAPVRYF